VIRPAGIVRSALLPFLVLLALVLPILADCHEPDQLHEPVLATAGVEHNEPAATAEHPQPSRGHPCVAADLDCAINGLPSTGRPAIAAAEFVAPALAGPPSRLRQRAAPPLAFASTALCVLRR
jgi:hypothetical protein